jgi:peroxiredoxin
MSGLIVGFVFSWLMVGLLIIVGAWLGFQLVHQNGRLLSYLEGIEQRLAALTARPFPAPAQAMPAPAPAPLPAVGPPAPQGLPLGSPAPAFALPDLGGQRQSLAEFRGKKLLLMFFNPRCGFCTRMAPELAALPVDGANGAPLPLVVTTGEVEENRKLVAEYGLAGPVLLQKEMEIASHYQCNGTPMGYLIDEQGRIASEMAIGAPALLALAADDRRPASTREAGAGDSGSGSRPLGGKRELSESKLQRDGLPPVEPILALLAPPAIAPSNGNGKLPHHGKELTRRR